MHAERNLEAASPKDRQPEELDSPTAERMEALWHTFASAQHVPGMVAGIVRDGRLAHLWTYGVTDLERGKSPSADTVFRIASMTKSFTALAVLLLRDEGLIGLDDLACSYISELACDGASSDDKSAITIRDLLVHQAGFVNDDPWADRQLGMDEERFTSFISGGLPLSRPPRTAFEYSNLGYALLGRIVANATGYPFQKVVEERLLQPLGMTATTFDPLRVSPDRLAKPYRWNGRGWVVERLEGDGAFGSIGGLATTASDYARYLSFLLSAWAPSAAADSGPVKMSTVREIAAVGGFRLPPYGPTNRDLGISSVYGCGIVSAVDRRIGRFLHHAGGLPGYGSHMLMLPDEGLALFTFANRTYAQPIEINRDIAALLLDAGYGRKETRSPSEPLRRVIEAVIAWYRDGTITVIQELADPVLQLDRPASERDAELREFVSVCGQFTAADVQIHHNRHAKLMLRGENGTIGCDILLAPTPESGIQKLQLKLLSAAEKQTFSW